VSRRVDDVDAMSRLAAHRRGVGDIKTPLTGDSRRLNRDAAFLLLRHKVGSCSTIVNFADAMHAAGVEKDALGRRGFAGVDVRGNADVASEREVILCGSGHDLVSS